MLLAATSIVLSAIYSIWIYNRIAYGTLKIESENVSNYTDLNREEFYILTFLTIGMLILGMHSGFITSLTNMPINTILEVIVAPKTYVFFYLFLEFFHLLGKSEFYNILKFFFNFGKKLFKIILRNNFIK